MGARVRLKLGRDKPVRGGNPWIFSQAIDRIEPAELAAGSQVEVFDRRGERLGVGYYNPKTTIAVRMLHWGGESRSIEDVAAGRIEAAIRLRAEIVGSDSDCYRLINGDGDGLGGLVVDKYRDGVVVQILTAGMEQIRAFIASELERQLRPRAILERSHGAVRREEGLEDRNAVLAGTPVSEIEVIENGIKLSIDLARGQKTGYFLDQRPNRARFSKLASGAKVLDACCYTGGFALAALKGGADKVVAVDTSAQALERAQRNLQLNGFDARALELVKEDAAKLMAAAAGQFDLIVLDPPPLARSRADAARAGHLYVQLNELALRALAPGGRLMTFSCSVHFRGEDFVRAVRIAAARARRSLRILEHLGPGPDHPVLLGHAEGEYLTGMLIAEL